MVASLHISIKGASMYQRALIFFVTIVLLVATFGVHAVVARDNGDRCFSATGQCISGAIRTYWEQNGGLAVFGFPTSAPTYEVVEGVLLTVQWFERDRLEIQANGQVTAGRLGVRLLELVGTPWQTGTTNTAAADCQVFGETGHQVCGTFAVYWRKNGGLPRFGSPITGAYTTTINGRSLTVQYFERRRFELHGENTVLLGLLGNEVRALASGAYTTPNHDPRVDAVQAAGTRLYAGGKAFEVRGINYLRVNGADPVKCWSLQFGADPNCPWDIVAMRQDFTRLHAYGINTIRIFLNYYVFGGSVPMYEADGSPSLALRHLSEFVQVANEEGLYVMPVLLAKYPQTQFGSVHMPGAFERHVLPIVDHFVGHPGIVAWDLFNEPDIGSPIDLRCWDWDNANYSGCFPLVVERQIFLATLADTVKAHDPTHLRTIAMAFAKSHVEPREAPLRIADMVDFYTFHYYDDSPYDSGRYKNHWYYGQGFPFDLHRSVRELHAIGQSKPIVITEIGFPTDPRDGTRTVSELQRDLQRSRDILRQSDVAGLMIWPFQDDYAHMLSSLYP